MLDGQADAGHRGLLDVAEGTQLTSENRRLEMLRP